MLPTIFIKPVAEKLGMAEDDSDFKDVLEGTVDEVKDKIRNLDSPDFEGLLEAEKDGKDRKTVKEFIESRIDSGDEDEDESEGESVDVDPDEVVEDIEEETEGGLLGSFSRTSVLAGGLILGIVLGFAAAGFSSMGGGQASPQQVQEDVRTIAGAGGNATVDVSSPEVRHSMYYFNVTISQDTVNGTVSQSQQVYVTMDGQKLFLVQERLGQVLRPIDVPTTLDQIEQAQNQQTQTPAPSTESGTGDSTPAENGTQ